MNKFMSIIFLILISLCSVGAFAQEQIHADGQWTFSIDRGKKWKTGDVSVPGGQQVTVLARAAFEVKDPDQFAFWELTHLLDPKIVVGLVVNDQEVSLPLAGMRYRCIPGIPHGLLRDGKNILMVRLMGNKKKKPKPSVIRAVQELPALAGQELVFKTGPLAGAFGPGFVSVTCRTSIPVPAVLHATFMNGADSAGSISLSSEAGFTHRFKVDVPEGTSSVRYYLSAESQDKQIKSQVHVIGIPKWMGKLGSDQDMKFVILGDSRSNVDAWGNIAQAVLNEAPEFLVFSGDMVGSGPNDWEWDDHYFAPESVKNLLATVPYYAVFGNHEENAPLLREVFYTPSSDGRADIWSQQLGSVHVIGVYWRWTSDWRERLKYLDKELSTSKAPFVFFTEHYPAWSSGHHGKVDPKTGESKNWSSKTCRSHLVPMLAKHKASALIVGHEHNYERSLLPGGLTQIISGGAGAPTSELSKHAEKQNPYSQKFVPARNYCLFEVSGKKCTMTVKKPDGTIIDSVEFNARE